MRASESEYEPHYEPGTFGWWMDQSRAKLDLKWRELGEISVPTGTLFRVAKNPQGMRSTTKQKIEHALHWAEGSIDAILAGGEPTPQQDVAVVVDSETGEVDAAQAVRRMLQLVPSIRRNAGPDRAREQLRLAWDVAVDAGVLEQVSDELAVAQRAL